MCTTEFEPATSRQKRCSKKCNSIASNTRRRADSAVKRCRTCLRDAPVAEFQPAHRSCLSCEALHEAGLKRCSKCGEVKDRADFGNRTGRPGGRDSACRACRSEYSRARNASPERKRINKDNKLRLKYGIGIEEANAMLERQQGRCGICGTTNKPELFHVDHDHSSGAVRELLCFHCNALLGHVKEDRAVLQAAILYLERHSHGQDLGA
ncbi:endonuclease VII domain-containing protein [Streptomyces canus]|uniref:endonuclease VII domain-containing protein n=1 Tax=Streptomyces canus TaxID=58343 RepID=UPI00358ECBFC